MKRAAFDELLGSAREALDHARGKRDLRTTILPAPPPAMDGRSVKRVRAKLHASQAVFASYFNVSTKLVQAWEGDRRTPDGPALVLLHIADDQPDLLEHWRDRHGRSAGRSRRRPARPPRDSRLHER